jgi:heptosyltransferase III
MSRSLADAIAPETLKRVLVIKLAHFGDVLLASPVLSVLKNHAPSAEVDALVYAETAPMLSGHPALAELFAIDRQWSKRGPFHQISKEWRLLRALRARRYDLVVALSDKPRIAWLTRFTGARYAVTAERKDRPSFWRRSFTHLYPLPSPNTRHTAEVHLDALRRIGIWPGMDERRVVLIPGEAAERRADALLREHGLQRGGFVQFHPGSRWLFKSWPAARVAELIDVLQGRGQRVVLTGAAEGNEAAYLREVLSAVGTPPVNLAGALDLKELAALTARARLFVGVDSAPLHVASAMRIPAVALFGPSGDVEWGPWQTEHRIVASPYPCRPCGVNGCGGSNRSECLETLPVARVLAAIDELSANARSGA